MMPGVRPSLWRPSAFAATWQSTTWVGLSVCVASVTMQGPEGLRAMGAPFAMLVAVIVLSELRPVVMTRPTGTRSRSHSPSSSLPCMCGVWRQPWC